MTRRRVWIAGQCLARGGNALLREGSTFGAVGSKFAQIKTGAGKLPRLFTVARFLFVPRQRFPVAPFRSRCSFSFQSRSTAGTSTEPKHQRRDGRARDSPALRDAAYPRPV